MPSLSTHLRQDDDKRPLPKLVASGKLLEATPDRLGWLKPSDPNTPIAELRNRYQRDGYLWLKGLLDPIVVDEFRGWVFEALADTGMLANLVSPVQGQSGGPDYDKQAANRRLMSLVRSARYEGFCAQPRLTEFIDRFIDGLSYLHKRKIMRFTHPGTEVATAAHYDLVYLRGGTSNLVTAWIPIGDCAVEEGGLLYLEGSHRIGAQMEQEFSRKNANLSPQDRISAYNANMAEGGWVSKDLPDMAERFDTRWLVADYEAGDVVLHTPFMIHASTNNVSPSGRIRLSTDIRFQNVDDEIDVRWSNHWSLDDML